jgi:hypothetical protein
MILNQSCAGGLRHMTQTIPLSKYKLIGHPWNSLTQLWPLESKSKTILRKNCNQVRLLWKLFRAQPLAQLQPSLGPVGSLGHAAQAGLRKEATGLPQQAAPGWPTAQCVLPCLNLDCKLNMIQMDPFPRMLKKLILDLTWFKSAGAGPPRGWERLGPEEITNSV